MALRRASLLATTATRRRNHCAAWWSRSRLVGCRLLLTLAFVTASSSAQTRCEGRPNSGVLRGARQLQTRPYLRVKAGSENRVWAHPLLLHLISRGARAAAVAVPRSVALVGDLSGPAGGALSGHASHQAGRDADVAFFVSNASGSPLVLDTFEAFDASGRSLEHSDHVFDAYRNWLLLREWLSELRVAVTHIFVSAELRQLLLEYGRQNPEFSRYVPLATQVLHAHPTHTDHFHLRIACPTDQGSECLDD